MRKQLKVLLLVAMVAVLFVMAMIVGSAETTEVADGAALVEAVANAAEGDTIKLTADITLDAGVVIDGKSLIIDGNNKTITLAESVTTGQIFNITAEAFTIQNVTLVANGLSNAGGAAAQLFNINGEVAFLANNVTATFASYLFQLTDPDADQVGDAMIDFVGCTLTYNGTYQVTRWSHKANPQSVTFDGCTIIANTVQTIAFKTEETTLTFNNCVIETNGAVAYSDSKATDVVITGAATNIKAEYVVSFKAKQAMNVTFGEEGVAADMQIECTEAAVYFNRPGTYAYVLNVYSGTFTAPALVANNGGTSTVVNVANVTVNGSLFDATAGKITVANSTINGVAGVDIAEFDIASMLVTPSIVVVPAQLIVNNAVVFKYTPNTYFAENYAILVPTGTMMAADQANDTYVQAVTYASASYKMYALGMGSFTNSAEAGAGLYVDSTANGSGLRFNTTITKAYIDSLLEKESKTIADLKFYTVIAPMDYVVKAGGVFTMAALDALEVDGAKYVKVEAVNSLAGIEGGAAVADITYSAALVSLKSYTRGYAAVSVIEYEGTEGTVTVYGDFNSIDNVRSAKQVADNMIADAASDYNVAWKPVSDPKAAVVDKYATGIVG
jgi:hypothetical protein